MQTTQEEQTVVNDDNDEFIDTLLDASNRKRNRMFNQYLPILLCTILVIGFLLSCFKTFCWLLFFILTGAPGDENELQRELLYNYATTPFTGTVFSFMFGPLYAASFYLSIVSIPMSILSTFVAYVASTTRRASEWTNMSSLILLCIFISDIHLAMSCFSLVLTLRLYNQQRSKTFIFKWNVVVLLIHASAVVGSVFSYLMSPSTSSLSGDSSLLIVYYGEIYCLLVFQALCVLVIHNDRRRKVRSPSTTRHTSAVVVNNLDDENDNAPLVIKDE